MDNGNCKAHLRILLSLTIMGIQHTCQIIYSNNFDDYRFLGYDIVLTRKLLTRVAEKPAASILRAVKE